MSLPISELFFTLETEGAFIGVPTLFLKFSGCSVGCELCGESYLRHTEEQTYTPEEVFAKAWQKLQDNKVRRISITGGNPFEMEEEKLIKLVELFQSKMLRVSIKHTGSVIDLEKELRILKKINTNNTMVLSLKSPTFLKNMNTDALINFIKRAYGNIKIELEYRFLNGGDIDFFEGLIKRIPNLYHSLSLIPFYFPKNPVSIRLQNIIDREVHLTIDRNYHKIHSLLSDYNGRLIYISRQYPIIT